jgi:hypothetical protein
VVIRHGGKTAREADWRVARGEGRMVAARKRGGGRGRGARVFFHARGVVRD